MSFISHIAEIALYGVVLASFPVFAVVAIGDLLTGGWQK